MAWAARRLSPCGQASPFDRRVFAFAGGLNLAAGIAASCPPCAPRRPGHHYNDLRGQAPPTVFRSAVQSPLRSAKFALRTTGAPSTLTLAVRESVRQIDPRLPIMNLTTQTAAIEQRMSAERLTPSPMHPSAARRRCWPPSGCSGWPRTAPPTDPVTIVQAAILLAVIAAAAVWLPARRAARVDPLTALQDE